MNVLFTTMIMHERFDKGSEQPRQLVRDATGILCFTKSARQALSTSRWGKRLMVSLPAKA
ncbi:MAG: hypothetical protein J0I79_27290 [Mesorhizobium sp.]|uniref:hypothetical protein n=1 Tax=Mesorhizobium sp. TaxID=1871066 RepID=UPI001AD0465C|nr:hypothetical protein [Mesorhizobium sp.]MBN9221665.1 hypothetical protein [Mesorhizobium sp.]